MEAADRVQRAKKSHTAKLKSIFCTQPSAITEHWKLETNSRYAQKLKARNRNPKHLELSGVAVRHGGPFDREWNMPIWHSFIRERCTHNPYPRTRKKQSADERYPSALSILAWHRWRVMITRGATGRYCRPAGTFWPLRKYRRIAARRWPWSRP